MANVPGRKRVIAVGRHVPQKGLDLLLEAFATVAAAHPDWDLAILGDGPDHPALKRQVQALGLEGRAFLMGIVPNILEELSNSQVMAFPSRYEGFPNALAEAMAAGLPTVGFAAVSGVEELIIDGKTGLLVDPKDGASGFARTLTRLLADSKLRLELAGAGRQHVLNWQPDRIFSLWEDCLEEAVASPITGSRDQRLKAS